MPYRNKRWRENLNRTFSRTDGRRNHKGGKCTELSEASDEKQILKEP